MSTSVRELVNDIRNLFLVGLCPAPDLKSPSTIESRENLVTIDDHSCTRGDIKRIIIFRARRNTGAFSAIECILEIPPRSMCFLGKRLFLTKVFLWVSLTPCQAQLSHVTIAALALKIQCPCSNNCAACVGRAKSFEHHRAGTILDKLDATTHVRASQVKILNDLAVHLEGKRRAIRCCCHIKSDWCCGGSLVVISV